MKAIASSLKLDLAQYWELQAFAQFASDLDKATQAQLARGERIVEVLKQTQALPMPLSEQVMIIFAATGGYADELALNQVKPWENGFYAFMKDKYPEIGATIERTKDLPAETKETLARACAEYTKQFLAR
jgi:F-type H+-transporting ATPase subunit alpha